MPGRTPEGDALTDLVLPLFEVAAELESAAMSITDGTSLSPAMWKVLGLVIDEPLTVAEISRRLGNARQSVQRLANVAVETGAAQWQSNPAHRRSPLLALTPVGKASLAELRPRQHRWANAVGGKMGEEDLQCLSSRAEKLLSALRDVSIDRAQLTVAE